MVAGARSPEELDALLEDAFIVRDAAAVSRLFEAGAVLVGGDGLARGRPAIARLAPLLWDHERSYVADPRRIVQARDTALLLAAGAVNVLQRSPDGSWRYRIAVFDRSYGESL